MQRHGHGAASRSRGNAWGVATAVAVAAGLGAPAAWAQTVVDRAAPAVEDRQPVASERARELARTVTIRRDAYGVPHVSAPARRTAGAD